MTFIMLHSFVSLLGVLPHLEGGGQACPSPTKAPNTRPGTQEALYKYLWKWHEMLIGGFLGTRNEQLRSGD